MALWIELLVALLIIYGAVLAIAMAWFSRRVRLTKLLHLREARQMMTRSGDTKEDAGND